MANLKNLYTITLLYYQDYNSLPVPDVNNVLIVPTIAKDQTSEMICPAIHGNSPALIPIPATVNLINSLHDFMDFSYCDHTNYPLFSDTKFYENSFTAPHNGMGYAVTTSGKIMEFTVPDVQSNKNKYVTTGQHVP
ncbi:MAG: hypothetical protein JW774_04575 [Candidatus Aureabacteria bacterium]|nr:hypothetical protein [Candidatus Auribacterota bacterium]